MADILNDFKKLFRIQDSISIGVDIGNKSIKLVELQRSQGKITLKNYANIKVKQELVKAGTPGLLNPQTGVVLAEIFKRTGIKRKRINLAVPGFASLITTLEMPASDEAEIEAMVSVEAPKYIPIPLSEVIYGWQTIVEKPKATVAGEEPAGEVDQVKRKRVLLVALMKEVSKKYEEVMSGAGFTINSIEVDAFSLKRALVANDKGCYVILDIGGKITNIIITLNGTIAVSRNIDVAGSRITEIIARGLSVTEDKAEQIKKSNGLKIDSRFGSSLVTSTIQAIMGETKRAMESFLKVYPDQTVEGIILNGGTSYMVGLKEMVEEVFKIKVTLANPWSRITYPVNMENGLMTHGPLFSVAVGLALQSWEER